MQQTNKPLSLKVLALDGGGMRGLYTASVLNTLSHRFGSGSNLDIGKGFDLIAGTSTGGILAAGLAAGVDLEQIISLYKNKGTTIFQNPMPVNKVWKIAWGVRNLLDPANSNQTLQNELTSIFQNETVGELYKRRGIALCLNSINIATHKARVFKTGHNPKKNADDNRLMRDICLATSAAPLIFPVAGIPDPSTKEAKGYFVDGGLWANNPILVALVEALSISEKDQAIDIISIGTCPPPGGSALTKDESQKGVLDWSFGIGALDLSMDAQASGNQFIANFLAHHFSSLGKKISITRLEQTAPSSDHAKYLGLDSVSEKACATLIQLGNADGLEIYGKAINGTSYQELKNIFESMPKFKEGAQ